MNKIIAYVIDKFKGDDDGKLKRDDVAFILFAAVSVIILISVIVVAILKSPKNSSEPVSIDVAEQTDIETTSENPYIGDPIDDTDTIYIHSTMQKFELLPDFYEAPTRVISDGFSVVTSEILAPTEDSESVVEEATVEVDQDDLELLAKVIYQEAGSDNVCDDCRRMVADVVLNRVESEYFPDTIEEVLTSYRQYGRYYWTGVIWPERAFSSSEAAAVERAYRIAEEVLSGQHSELYGQGYIWQAEFSQGTDTVYHCGIYFGR